MEGCCNTTCFNCIFNTYKGLSWTYLGYCASRITNTLLYCKSYDEMVDFLNHIDVLPEILELSKSYEILYKIVQYILFSVSCDIIPCPVGEAVNRNLITCEEIARMAISDDISSIIDYCFYVLLPCEFRNEIYSKLLDAVISFKRPPYYTGCRICRFGVPTVKHHISYNPEVVIMLCTECHRVVHTSEFPNPFWKQKRNEKKLDGRVKSVIYDTLDISD